jgi:hypothetical protein
MVERHLLQALALLELSPAAAVAVVAVGLAALVLLAA